MIQGTASFKLARKMKILKNEIKEWIKHELKREGEDFGSIMNELHEIDQMEGMGELNEEVRNKRKRLNVNLSKKCRDDEISWKQKFRER